ncbi:MAG: prepilin-type N-terminal cleavage/methylation domain-containing protein [Desulfobacteraceae bacterium]|nr:prepilin-type N-terminal cleavage/methylation domain-containing protein [Desulfobacteraceae bacterium]MBU4054286.1 prepilin-type N-terminal cleavage/methylation domain-containing protein [Pseudomonadota bacterium]
MPFAKRHPHFTGSDSGFSLIELIAVISVVSIMLFLTLPRFDIFSRQGDLKGAARWIMAQVPGLKAKALEEQKQFLLTVDLDQNTLGVFPGEIPEKTEEEEKTGTVQTLKSYPLSDSVRLKDVTFPEAGVITSGQPGIRFYKKGYCDKVIIHLQDDNNQYISLFIEPFLNTVVLREGYIGFEG